MKRLKITLFVIASISFSQPAMSAGVGGKMTPPAAAITIDTQEQSFVDWLFGLI